MFYGHKDSLDGSPVTIISSADTIPEYETLADVVASAPIAKKLYTSTAVSNGIQHMLDDTFIGFKRPVTYFVHSDEAQRDSFFAAWALKECFNGVEARDMQIDMISNDEKRVERARIDEINAARIKANETGEDYAGPVEKTIGELTGTDVYDPWDTTSKEERESDAKIKAQIQAAQQSGQYSGEFPTAKPKTPQNAGPSININAGDIKFNADGTVDTASFFGTKTGGEVDERLKKAREEAAAKVRDDIAKGKTKFTDADFEEVLSKGIADPKRLVDPNAAPDEANLSEGAKAARAALKQAELEALKASDPAVVSGKGGFMAIVEETTNVESKQPVVAETPVAKATISHNEMPEKLASFIASHVGQSEFTIAYGEIAGLTFEAKGDVLAVVNATVEETRKQGSFHEITISIKDESKGEAFVIMSNSGDVKVFRKIL